MTEEMINCYVCQKKIKGMGLEYELLIKGMIRSVCLDCYDEAQKNRGKIIYA